MQDMIIRGCFWGVVAGAGIAGLITIASVLGDPTPLSEGKWGATWIMLTLTFAVPGALIGAVVGFVVSLFYKR